MVHPSAPAHHHTMKFYIVIVTLVVAGIFGLLMLNNGDSGISLTSALVGNDDTTTTETTSPMPILAKEKAPLNDPNEFYIDLQFDTVPSVSESETSLDAVEVKFTDITSTIMVNNDKLELSDLTEVTLTIDGFNGEVDFGEVGISLDGLAKKIAVNNVALISDKEIEIEFYNLEYTALSIDNIELDEVELESGDGTLQVEDSLTYTISNEKVGIVNFVGTVAVGAEGAEKLQLTGSAKGIASSGGLFDLGVQ